MPNSNNLSIDLALTSYVVKPAQRDFTAGLFSLSISALLVIALTFMLAACGKRVEKTEDVRPVKAMLASMETSEVIAEFSGEIRPRIESKLGFRVPGKIVERKVDIGSIVKRGQILMQLDPQDLLLGQAQAKAGLSAAESNRDLAKAELKRYQDLREKNFVSQAVLDAKETSFKAAQASFDQAKAGFSNQSNLAGYSSLISDVDGVVTGIDVEVGQVVAAGSPVVRVAKAGELDMVVGIPEDKINSIRSLTDVRVHLLANPNEVIVGKLRELSPIADPVTRTFAAKIALPESVKGVRLGMTAAVSFGVKNPVSMIRLPLNALFQEKDVTSVWLVQDEKVKLVPIQIGATTGEYILVASGVVAGQTVVTAGVNMLKEGQKVKILGLENSAAAQTAQAKPSAAQAGVVK